MGPVSASLDFAVATAGERQTLAAMRDRAAKLLPKSDALS
jgi:hypothetical protein